MAKAHGFKLTLAAVAALGALGGIVGGAAWLETRPDLATRWNTYELPSGLVLEAPNGWTVTASAAPQGVAIAGTHNERMLLWQLPGDLGEPAVAPSMVNRLAARIWPEADWMPLETTPGGGFRCYGRTAASRGSFSVTPLASPGGEVWMASLATAPVTRARASDYRLEHALGSLRFALAPTGSGQAEETHEPGRVALLRASR